MTLTEFLLARIAEDEKAARRGSDHPAEWGVLTNDNYGHLLTQPSRVLAECAAKRQIVGWMNDTVEYVVYADEVLGALALPYADHPDYDEAWRP